MYRCPMDTTTKTLSSISSHFASLRSERIQRKLATARRVEAAASAKTESARSEGQVYAVRRLERRWFRKSLKTQKFRDLCAAL